MIYLIQKNTFKKIIGNKKELEWFQSRKKLCQNEPKKKNPWNTIKNCQHYYYIILLYYTQMHVLYYYVCTQLLSWGPIRKHYWITHLTSPRGKMNSSKVRQGTTQAKPTCPFKKLQKWQTTPSGELLEHFFICLILCYKLCCCHNKWSYVAWW